eukprot:54621-Prymnesium_polylepis.1
MVLFGVHKWFDWVARGSQVTLRSVTLHIAVLRVYPLDLLRTLFTTQPIASCLCLLMFGMALRRLVLACARVHSSKLIEGLQHLDAATVAPLAGRRAST